MTTRETCSIENISPIPGGDGGCDGGCGAVVVVAYMFRKAPDPDSKV